MIEVIFYSLVISVGVVYAIGRFKGRIVTGEGKNEPDALLDLSKNIKLHEIRYIKDDQDG